MEEELGGVEGRGVFARDVVYERKIKEIVITN